MIPTSNEGSTCRRAESGSVEVGISQSRLCNTVKGWCRDWTPERTRRAEAHTSSVRMSKIFGAPLGGCTSLGKSGTESLAVRPIRPLNGGSGLGRVSCASTGNQPIVDIAAPTNNATQAREKTGTTDVTFIVLFLSTRGWQPELRTGVSTYLR